MREFISARIHFSAILVTTVGLPTLKQKHQIVAKPGSHHRFTQLGPVMACRMLPGCLWVDEGGRRGVEAVSADRVTGPDLAKKESKVS
jgi:hypothetical protein